jgi:hypothetical protein
MSNIALIKVLLYVTLSLTANTANCVTARFSLRLPSSRIVRPCCLVDRCQRFGVTSCLHFQDVRVIVRSCKFSRYQGFGGISSLPSSLQKSVVPHKYLETFRGLFLQGRTLDIMPCTLLDMYQHGRIRSSFTFQRKLLSLSS